MQTRLPPFGLVAKQLASLAAHQFRLPPSYPPGPQLVILGDSDGRPFGSYREMPPLAPLSNGPYWLEPPMYYGVPFGGRFLRSGRQHVAASRPQQPSRPAGARRGR
jgi:hypothetical protein